MKPFSYYYLPYLRTLFNFDKLKSMSQYRTVYLVAVIMTGLFSAFWWNSIFKNIRPLLPKMKENYNSLVIRYLFVSIDVAFPNPLHYTVSMHYKIHLVHHIKNMLLLVKQNVVFYNCIMFNQYQFYIFINFIPLLSYSSCIDFYNVHDYVVHWWVYNNEKRGVKLEGS